MIEVRFKLLKKGDSLVSFTKHNLVIKKENGEFYIYTLSGFDSNKPVFSKNFEVVHVFTSDLMSEGFALVRKDDDYYIYIVMDFNNGIPEFDKDYCIVIKMGNDKIEYFDTVSRIRSQIPAEAI